MTKSGPKICTTSNGVHSKQVYCVRHGESTANAEGIRRDDTTPLSPLGETQAALVAKRLAQVPLGRIIASPFVRARQTMKPIAEAHAVAIVEISPLFVERRNPSTMLGKAMDDPGVEAIWEIIAKNYHIPGWKHSDEENFTELRRRAQEALIYLETLSEEHILVITHGMFLKVLFALSLLGERLDGRIFWDQFIPIKNIVNTGLMHLEYAERYDKTGFYWKLISWNDHAHLVHDQALLNKKRLSSPHG